MPAKHFDMHAAMRTHLSQPTGAAALEGQQGISFAISSVSTETDVSSAIGCIDTVKDVSAIAGRDNGANTTPAITRTASSRRMAELLFTNVASHKLAATESPTLSLS